MNMTQSCIRHRGIWGNQNEYYVKKNLSPKCVEVWFYWFCSLIQSSKWKFEFTGPDQILEFIIYLYLY